MNKDNISALINTERKARNEEHVRALQGVLAAIQERESRENRDLGIADVFKVIKREISAYQEMSNAPSGTSDRIAFLEGLLPPSKLESEMVAMVEEAFDAVQPESIRDMGKVIAHIKGKGESGVDYKFVSSQVKAALISLK